MFQGLQENQLKGAVEALLFVTDEPVGTIALADMLEVEPLEAERALVDLREQLAEENRGIQLREVAGGWRLYTHPVYHELIEKYVLSWDTRKLSQAAMETLAIVAYMQPVTRSGVASVRGVNSDSSINSLVEKDSCAKRALPTLRAIPRSTPRRVRFWKSSGCVRLSICPTSTNSRLTTIRAPLSESVFLRRARTCASPRARAWAERETILSTAWSSSLMMKPRS